MHLASLADGSRSSRSTLIGVAISLAGNVLISLALNCQKLAHTRLQRQAEGLSPEWDDDDEGEDTANGDGVDENAPLLKQKGHKRHSSSASSSPKNARSRSSSNASFSRSDGNRNSNGNSNKSASPSVNTGFLRSRLWWLGLSLMTLGEFGNFLSYAYAPASLVAPLGAVALLSNVVIAPILLKERFRPSDIGGIILAIIGAVTVVFSSKQSDATLNADELLQAILRLEFLIYTIIVASSAAALAYVSSTSFGDRYILIDVGVCALFGGFTVLSTKGLSSLLSLGQPLELIRLPITYLLVVVLAGTAVAQITYLNRALQRFDSREVIPTQFVLFTISAIVGSAILYRDFDNVEIHRLINFLFGCATTFSGVFVLTRSKSDDNDDDDEGDGGGDENEEEMDEESADLEQGQPSSRVRTPVRTSAMPVVVPRTHPAAANIAGRLRTGTSSRRKSAAVDFQAGSVPTVAVHRPRGHDSGAALGTSVPVLIARRSIFNPAFTIAYYDQHGQGAVDHHGASTPQRRRQHPRHEQQREHGNAEQNSNRSTNAS